MQVEEVLEEVEQVEGEGMALVSPAPGSLVRDASQYPILQFF